MHHQMYHSTSQRCQLQRNNAACNMGPSRRSGSKTTPEDNVKQSGFGGSGVGLVGTLGSHARSVQRTRSSGALMAAGFRRKYGHGVGMGYG
jgi:hypothetical protein